MSPPAHASRWLTRNEEPLGVAAIVGLGLLLRLQGISYNFDGDELWSVSLASQSLSGVLSASLQDTPHPPLHNLLLYLWMPVFGAGEVAARALSVACSLGFLLLAYKLLRRWLPPWLALGVLAVLALSPLFVRYGQQARPYALITVLSAANLLAFFHLLDGPLDRKRRIVWTLSGIALLYSQYLAGIVILFETGFLVLRARGEWRSLLAHGVAAPLLILPWLLASMGGAIVASRDPLPYIAWMTAPGPGDLVWSFFTLFGDPPGLHQAWLLMLLVPLGLWYLKARLLERRLPADHAFLFLLGVGVPALVWVVAVLSRPVFAQRQLLGSSLALAALTGLGLATLPRRFAVATLAILVLWTTAALPSGFPNSTKPPWREMAAHIDAGYPNRSAVTQERWVANPLRFYRRSGTVESWGDANRARGGFLFACRPGRCDRIEAPEFAGRVRLLNRWSWGWTADGSARAELLLYEIRAAR